MSDPADKIIERIVASEKALQRMKDGKYENFQLFVFGAAMGVRKISDVSKFKAFGKSENSGENDILAQLINGSEPELYVLTSYSCGSPYFHVFGTEGAITSSDSFLASCIKAIVERTYRAVGIDSAEIEEDEAIWLDEEEDDILDH